MWVGESFNEQTLTVALALVTGLLGGLLARFLAPPAAFAQNQAPIAKEIRAQSFTLVDPSDNSVGVFTSEPVFRGLQSVPRRPMPMRIVLRDSNGREIWSAGGAAIRPASER
jgi:hypothetical protein